MGWFKRRKKKTRKWIAGPLRDWIVPYRCNLWFQAAHVLLIVVALCLGMYWRTRSVAELALAYLTLLVAVSILGITEFGSGTVKAYRRTREIIERQGKLKSRVQISFGKKMYCFRTGVRTAANDFGLSQELIPTLKNKWRPF